MAEEIAEEIVDWSSWSAEDGELDSLLFTSSLVNLLRMGDTVDCLADRRVKGVDVVNVRDDERKEVEGEEIARNAERRIRCLLNCY